MKTASPLTDASPEPTRAPPPSAVREQLVRILESAPFRKSRRYPALLRHVVERTLEGDAAGLKERSLAIDVFGRDPGYDPSLDPVVRITAAEVRRRLAQYYQEPGRAGEVRIDLPVGAYVPEFRRLSAAPSPPAVASSPARRGTRHAPLAAMALAVAALLAWFVWWPSRPAATELDRFWSPVVAPGGSVLACVGVASVPARPAPLSGVGVPWPDVQALVRIGGLLQSKGQSVELCREAEASFADFQRMPAVLIGAFNDEWTLRLLEDMRFQFQRDGGLFWIADREQPGSRKWSIDTSRRGPDGRLAIPQDYAIVSRVRNARTGQISVIVAGLWGYGTVAATQLLTEPHHFEELAKTAPAGWRERNLQIVLGTEVIDHVSGPPRVLSIAVW